MFKLAYVPPAQATGQVKESYGIFPAGMEPPKPMQMLSVSPGVQGIVAQNIKYFMGHPRLSHQMLASIRYLAAKAFEYPFCIGFNRSLLERMGMEPAEVDAMVADPSTAPLEPNELVLLGLVADLVRDPASVTEAAIQRCRDAGWVDSDIFDACYQAANMRVSGQLMAAFAK